MSASIPDGIRDIDVLGFSAGSYTGLAIHKVLHEFDCFPGTMKVAAIASLRMDTQAYDWKKVVVEPL